MTQCQDNMTEWDIRWPGFPGVGGSTIKVAMTELSQIGTHPDMTLDVARMSNSNNQPTNLDDMKH